MGISGKYSAMQLLEIEDMIFIYGSIYYYKEFEKI